MQCLSQLDQAFIVLGLAIPIIGMIWVAIQKTKT